MALYVLDTDTLTLLQHNDPLVAARVTAAGNQVAITAITLDEQLTGRFAQIRRAQQPSQIESAYTRLAEAVVALASLPILPYTQAAIARYGQLLAQKLNVGKNDLRIGAIALEYGAVVVTRNVRDFGRIPNLIVEDWSTPPQATPAPAPATGS
jgi:tRNA(fMet)-specific endonuclease VapC